MIPTLKIFNLKLDLLALIDDYESLYFEEKYADIGNCIITMSASSENFKMLEKGLILYLDKFNCWIIEEIDIDNDLATITGLNLSFIFSHRVTVPLQGNTHLSSKDKLTGDIIKYFVDKCVINAVDKKRNIPLKIINSKNLGHRASYKSRYKNLLNEVQALCTYSALGFRLGIDIKSKDFIFEVYSGRELSKEVIFSEMFDNIEDIKINDSNADYKNYVYIAARGQGLDRQFLTAGEDSFSGWHRREEIIDVRDKESEEEAYLEGDTLLAEKCVKTSLEVVVLDSEDVEVGDIVTVLTSRYNYQFTQRIIEKNVEYTTESGKVVGVIIGNPKPTLKFEKDDSIIE